MNLPRRWFLHLAAGAAALPAVSRIALAQAYPTRPVRLLIGFAPGGTQDVVGRLLGQWLTERLGQQVIIENAAGRFLWQPSGRSLRRGHYRGLCPGSMREQRPG